VIFQTISGRPIHYKSKLVALSEIATMSFARELLHLSYNPYVFDSIYRTGIQLKSKVVNGDPEAPYYRKGSAASHISTDEIDEIDLEDIKHVHITVIPPALSKSCRQATYRLLERAKEKNIYISFDPNLRPALWESKEVMIRLYHYRVCILP
jgi:sugar/nucleoside kinase (ribokinase family)